MVASPLEAPSRSTRVGAARTRPIALVVLHSDPRLAEQALAALLDSHASAAPHYYVAAAGTVVAIVPELRAARHSGTATWHGRRRTIDTISIGIVLEHTPGMPYSAGQQVALLELVDQLAERYQLAGDFLMRWEAAGQGVQRRGALLRVSISPDRFFELDVAAASRLAEERRRLSALLDVLVLGIDDAALWTALQQDTYVIRGGDFHPDWAFHQVAITNNFGAPLAQSANQSRYLLSDGQTYGYQPFAHDTLISATNAWGSVSKLSDLLNGTIPAAGLGRVALEASYMACSGSPLHADWSFHQVAVRERLGSPLSGNYATVLAGQHLALQVFAGDTLYTLIADPDSATNWNDVRRLSQTPAGSLADALWVESYKPCGATYDSAAPLHQEAVRRNLGAPLSGPHSLTVAGTAYTVQVFAYDTLYLGPENTVSCLSALPPALPAPSPVPIQSLNPVTASTPWLAQHPTAPAPARLLINQALSMLGSERIVFDALPDNLRTLAYGAMSGHGNPNTLYFKDIVCADLVTICLAAAGLDYSWNVSEPAGTGFANPHCANYYRPSATNTKLRQLDDNDPNWLPGDILVYWYSGTAATKTADHVNIYIGPYLSNGKPYEIVEASINYVSKGAVQGLNNVPQRKVYCWDQDYFHMATCLFRMRVVALEDAYRAAGIL